jgi:hypothetical protein
LQTADVVQTFLPQGGAAWPLDRCYVDPPHVNLLRHKGKFKHHLMIGQLAGNTLALRLNVDFSTLGITKTGLANLKLASGSYTGKTVSQILAMANSALAGDPLPSGVTYNSLNQAVENINKNFNAGTENKGFLVP